jgi:hypothetical protein
MTALKPNHGRQSSRCADVSTCLRSDLSLSYVASWPFSNWFLSIDLVRCSYLDRFGNLFFTAVLPRSLGDTRKLTTVSHFAEAHTADTKLLINRVWTSATLATCIAANLELRLASCLYLERCLCHGLCLLEWKAERLE